MLFTLLALFLCVPPGTAQDVAVRDIEVVEYGIFSADTGNLTQGPQGIGRMSIGNLQHTARSRIVPAELGVRFGFVYRIAGEPEGAPLVLRKVVTFPAPGLRASASSESVTVSEIPTNTRIGDQRYTGYGFDEAFELVPGTWTIALWYGDRLLTSQSFTVVTP